MIIRKALSADIPQVLLMQEKNLVTNLPTDQLKNGFVTTPFTIPQIEEIMKDNGLFLAMDGEELAAYVFVGTWSYYAQWPIFPYMNARFPALTFNGGPITMENSFQYGPICVGAKYRGSGVLLQIFEGMRLAWKSRFPISGTFINKRNERSMYAHTHKMGWQVIDEFSFNSNEYCTLAYDMERSVFQNL